MADALSRARAQLFAARAHRPRPHLDDKVLTAWNGLMIAAFARAARVLAGRATAPRYLAAGRRAAEFIRRTLWIESEQRLLRRYRDGDAAIDGYAEDYAYLISGLLELFQADGDPAWLEWAMALQAAQDRLFWDEADAGWFSTTGNDPSVLLRLKEDYDGAEPAAGSVSVLNLATFESLIGGGAWMKKAERTLARFGPKVGAAGRVVPMLLAGLSAWHADHTQIVIVGPADREDTLAPAARGRTALPAVRRRRPGAARPAAGRALDLDAVRRTDAHARGTCDGVRLPCLHVPRAGHRRRGARGSVVTQSKCVILWLPTVLY